MFGEAFCRRKTTYFDDMDIAKCHSTGEKILVGGGKNFCTFVLKHEVAYMQLASQGCIKLHPQERELKR